jgi:hypothetical protein
MAKAAASIVMLATLPDAVPSLEVVVSITTSVIPGPRISFLIFF